MIKRDTVANDEFLGATISEKSSLSVDVVEATPAVTEETIYTDFDGQSQPVGDLGHRILVADVSGEEKGTVAILSVDMRTANVHGVVVKKGQNAILMDQRVGKAAVAMEDTEFTPPAWACGVDEHAGRMLIADNDDHSDYGHSHEHDSYDSHDHREHYHSMDEDLVAAIDSMRENLRGTKVNIGKRRKLLTSSYTYQVDLFIEGKAVFFVMRALDTLTSNPIIPLSPLTTVDSALISKLGSETEAKNYVNIIFTAANAVYEHEIDTHLHVVEIRATTIYDYSIKAIDAIGVMTDVYGSGTWHTPGIDLHHAMLGRNVGGGIA